MSLKDAVPLNLIENDEELNQLISALDDGLNSYLYGTDRIYRCFDLSHMDNATMEKWLHAFGWKWRWIENRKLLLRLLLNIYRWRGTKEGIEKTINIIYGINISVKELWPFFYRLGRNIPDEDKNKAVIYLVPDLWKWTTAIEAVVLFMKPAHASVELVGLPDRMMLMNVPGPLKTVVQDLSWRETRSWKVFTGPRFNAAGAVEIVTEDTSWSETFTFKTFTGSRLGSMKLNTSGPVQTVTTDKGWDEVVTHYKFTGPRFNGPDLKFNGTGKNNEGPKTSEQAVVHHEVLMTKKTFPDGQILNTGATATQEQIIHHPGVRTYKRFVAPIAALNARGTIIEDVVDHGWDETITEHRFAGPRLNSPPTLSITGQARLNDGPKTSEQVVVHHPVLETTVKTDGGTIFNRGSTETRMEIVNHPDVRTYKKFDPETGMLLNSNPVLGYMWKKELKEAV